MKGNKIEGFSSDLGIRVRTPDTGHAPARDVFYTLDQLAEQWYRWGRQDEKARWQGDELAGLGQGWTVGGFDLDTMRRSSESPRRD